MKTSIKKLLALLTLFAMMANSFHSVAAQYDDEEEQDFQEEEEFEPEEDPQEAMTVVFSNLHPRDSIELYWVNHEYDEDDPERLQHEATIPPRGGVHHSDTFLGHEFAFKYNGEMHYFTATEPNSNNEEFVVLGGETELTIPVRCDTTTDSGKGTGMLDIHVKPSWAPRGASRFLELVRQKYYDGVVFNRVVPKFLTQFGVAVDHEAGAAVRDTAIWDDVDSGVKFQAGTISFAGNGPDSRTAEVFIAMPGASQEQLSRFGRNDWETPFGIVVSDLENGVLGKIYSGYGDMPPWGKGPDTNLMYAEDGYTKYLPTNFPLLDKIIQCYVVEEVGLYGADEL